MSKQEQSPFSRYITFKEALKKLEVADTITIEYLWYETIANHYEAQPIMIERNYHYYVITYGETRISLYVYNPNFETGVIAISQFLSPNIQTSPEAVEFFKQRYYLED